MRKDIRLSRKPIKSGFGGTAIFEIIDDKLMEARRNIRSCISISTRKELDDELREIDELIGDTMTHTKMMKNGDYDASMFSSRKPIKSDYKGLDEEVGDLQIDMTNTGYFEDGWLLLEGENEEGYRDGTEFTINAYGPNGEDLGSKKFDFLDLWHNGRPVNSSRKPDVNSSIQGQERAIQAIMDEYGCTREEAIDIMNGEVTSSCEPIKSSSMKYGDFLNQLRKEGYPEEAISAVIADNAYMITEDDIYTDADQRDFRRRLKNEISSGCHGKAKKKAKKKIRSSLMDEFEESYTAAASEWSEEEYNALLDDFITDFAKEHNITYEEVEKMQKQLEDKWYKDSDNASIVDIYSSANRNEKNLNCIFKN